MIHTTVQPSACHTRMAWASRCRTPRSSASTPMKIAKKPSQMSQFMASWHGVYFGGFLLFHQIARRELHVQRERSRDVDGEEAEPDEPVHGVMAWRLLWRFPSVPSDRAPRASCPARALPRRRW